MKQVNVLVVGGESCANCYSLLPLVKRLAEERALPLRYTELDEGNAEEMKRLGVERVPSVFVMLGEEPFAVCTGYQPEEILEVWLDAKLAEAQSR